MIGSNFPACHPRGDGTPSHPRGRRRIRLTHRHTWQWAAGVAAALGLLAWFLYSHFSARGFDVRLFLSSVSGIRWEWVLLAVTLMYGTYYGRALRWAVLLKPLRPHPRMSNLLSATIIGFTAITLFGRPGEIVRPYLISVKEQVPLASQLAAWIVERIYDLLMALLVFGFALARVTSSGMQVGPSLAWILGAGGETVAGICLLLIVILLLFRHFAEPMRRRLTDALRVLPEPQFVRVSKLVTAFVNGIESTRSDAALLLLLFYSVVEWVLIAACYWCIARAFPHVLHLSLVDILIFMGFVSFGSVVQLPGIGGGMQVVSVVVLTELFGLRLEVATSFALFTWFITFVVIVPVGLLEALREGLNWRSLKQIGLEVPE
jgi:glycosyltransferase 2 family protein